MLTRFAISAVLFDHTRIAGSPLVLLRIPEKPFEPSPNS